MARRNPSAQRLAEILNAIPQAVREQLEKDLIDQANGLADTMRRVVPEGVDGRNELLESIRVERSNRPLRVLVKAGGSLTTKEVRNGSGKTYDYALANEFGTAKMTAQPFFWPTYRLKKKAIRAALSRSATKGIKKVVPLK